MKMYICLVEKSYVKEAPTYTSEAAPGTDCKIKPESVSLREEPKFLCYVLKYLLRTSLGDVRARCEGNWGLAKTYVAAL